MGKVVILLCLLIGTALAAPLRDAAPTTTTTTTTHIGGMQPLTEEAEPFYADEEANWEAYAETQQEEHVQEEGFDEEYQRYLDEMAEAMLTDKALRGEIIKELSSITSEEQLSKEDAELLRIANHLQDEDVRSELEEQERVVVERQRRMARRENEHELGVPERADEVDFRDADQDLWDDPDAHEKQLRHIAEQRLKLLTNIDETHHQAFVQREMARELRFREQLNQEPSADRRAELAKHHKEEFERIKAMHGHHPGSQQQLEEVWKETDGLVDEKFDPMVFFHLHDLNGDGYLDEKELEAIFYHEARKLHDIDGNLDDLAVQEEMRRMRAHVEGEADMDKDGMLSQHEFLDMTHRVDFNSDPAWNALVPEFTEEKLREFESRRRAARNRDRHWQDNGEHIDEAVIEASRRLEQDVWREQHGKPRLPRGRLGPAAVHHGQPLPVAPEQEHHEQPAAGHPADAAHPAPEHPAAADHPADHPPKPADHPADAAHPAEHAPEHPAEAKPADHPAAAAAADHPAKPVDHAAAAADHAGEHVVAKPADAAHPAAAADHAAAPAHPSDSHPPAANHEALLAKPDAAKQPHAEDHPAAAAAHPADTHAQPAAAAHPAPADHPAQPAAAAAADHAADAAHPAPADHPAQPAAAAAAAAAHPVDTHAQPAAAADHPAQPAAAHPAPADHPAQPAAADHAAAAAHPAPADHPAQPAAAAAAAAAPAAH